jgi:hypothetical protein
MLKADVAGCEPQSQLRLDQLGCVLSKTACFGRKRTGQSPTHQRKNLWNHLETKGFQFNEVDGARTRNLRIDSPTDEPKATNENIGDLLIAADGCTNGCTCDRYLEQLAGAIRDRCNENQSRWIARRLLDD